MLLLDLVHRGAAALLAVHAAHAATVRGVAHHPRPYRSGHACETVLVSGGQSSQATLPRPAP